MSAAFVCAICARAYPAGTILCPEDGHEFVAGAASPPQLPADVPSDGLAPIKPPRLVLAAINGQRVVDGAVAWMIPDGEFRTWLIGRTDLAQGVRAPVDLAPFFTLGLAPVSRLQSWLEREGDELRLRAGTGAATWVRATGSRRAKRVKPNTYRVLAHRDVIVFGDPRGEHVQLRVYL